MYTYTYTFAYTHTHTHPLHTHTQVCTLVFVVDILICFRTGVPIGSRCNGMRDINTSVYLCTMLR